MGADEGKKPSINCPYHIFFTERYSVRWHVSNQLSKALIIQHVSFLDHIHGGTVGNSCRHTGSVSVDLPAPTEASSCTKSPGIPTSKAKSSDPTPFGTCAVVKLRESSNSTRYSVLRSKREGCASDGNEEANTLGTWGQQRRLRPSLFGLSTHPKTDIICGGVPGSQGRCQCVRPGISYCSWREVRLFRNVLVTEHLRLGSPMCCSEYGAVRVLLLVRNLTQPAKLRSVFVCPAREILVGLNRCT
jgi:hypothetical protein